MGDPSCGPGAYGGDPNMGGGYPPEEFVPVPAHAQTTSDDFIPVNTDMGGALRHSPAATHTPCEVASECM